MDDWVRAAQQINALQLHFMHSPINDVKKTLFTCSGPGGGFATFAVWLCATWSWKLHCGRQRTQLQLTRVRNYARDASAFFFRIQQQSACRPPQMLMQCQLTRHAPLDCRRYQPVVCSR